MNRITLAALACTSTLLGLSACDNNNNSPPGTGEVRLVNGIPDSGSVSASPTSGDVFNTQGQAFDKASGAEDAPEGNYNVQLVNSTNPSFATIENVKVSHNTLTALWTRGSLDTGTGSGFAVQENLGTAATSGDFDFIFVNDSTASGAATLSVYLVTPGSPDLTGLTPAASGIAAGTASTVAQIKAGTYEVIVTNGTTPIFDSGSAGISFPGSGASMVQMGALDASSAQVTSNTAPITLMILDNGNNDSDSQLVLNQTPAS
jgi:hypothetical protein